MGIILKLKRGTTVKNNSYTVLDGEVTVDSGKNALVVHDGGTPGGSPLATEAQMNTAISAAVTPVTSQLAEIGKPITTYIHTTNREVIVSNVDIYTNVFTSTAHGLNDGNSVVAILNMSAESEFLQNRLPGGVSVNTRYYVVQKTDNTFKLSPTNGGEPITLSTNANIDLTKWHFETAPAVSVVIENLPNLTNFDLVIRGRNFISNTSAALLMNSSAYEASYFKTAETVLRHPTIIAIGDVHLHARIKVRTRPRLTYDYAFCNVRSNTTTEVFCTYTTGGIISDKLRNILVTSVNLRLWNFANGTTVEVYNNENNT